MKHILKFVLIAFLIISSALKAQDNSGSKNNLSILTLGDSNGTFPWSWLCPGLDSQSSVYQLINIKVRQK